MKIEVEVLTEGVGTPVFSVDTEMFGPGDEPQVFFGVKTFNGKPGHFKYDWFLEYLSLPELLNMAESLSFVIDTIMSAQVCDDCKEA
jgi:hypothetical protein